LLQSDLAVLVIFVALINSMLKIAFVILLLVVSSKAGDQVHEVIIIGAGLAGIAASKVLTDQHISHLLIEARNRVGGRVAAVDF
jgi:heterodisulfide reductase subunit A-like polyferredoxin